MRRDAFLKTLTALAAAGALPLPSWAAANLKMMIPANPGGGWDGTGRALGKALQEAGVASSVSFDNKGGAAGAIGLAQFVNGSKGDPNALLIMGAVMLGGLIVGKPPVDLSQATPLARLLAESQVFVLPAASPLKGMKDVIEQMKKDPGSVKWGGGSRGSTEHIAAAMIARAVGVDPAKINYVAFSGGPDEDPGKLASNTTQAQTSDSNPDPTPPVKVDPGKKVVPPVVSWGAWAMSKPAAVATAATAVAAATGRREIGQNFIGRPVCGPAAT